MEFDVKNMDLAPGGRRRIDWANQEMAVLAGIKEQFEKDPRGRVYLRQWVCVRRR